MKTSQESSHHIRTYNAPLQKEILDDLSHKNFSPDTMKKVKWVRNMYVTLRNHRNTSGVEQIVCDLEKKETFSETDLAYALCRFITEVKKLDGTEFPGKTLYDIVICVQFYLEILGFSWKLLNNEAFTDMKFTLDNVMKMRTAAGIGTSVKKANFMSSSNEDYLWSLGFLGTHSPDVLLNTVVFIMGKGFALRAEKEHQALRSPPLRSQFLSLHDDDGKIFIRYNEEIGLKTSKGGIKHRKIDPKEVNLYPIENPDRCPV